MLTVWRLTVVWREHLWTPLNMCTLPLNMCTPLTTLLSYFRFVPDLDIKCKQWTLIPMPMPMPMHSRLSPSDLSYLIFHT